MKKMDLFNVLQEVPNLNFIIYKEKIVYANKSTIEKLGYSKEELLTKSIEDLVSEEYRSNVKKIKEKRLKGEQFFQNFLELPIITKNKILLRCFIFSATIEYEGSPAGLIIAIDITEKYLLEKVIKLMGEVHELGFNIFNEKEFIENVCKKIVENLTIIFSYVVEYKDNKFEAFTSCGKADLKEFEQVSLLNRKEYINLLKENQIIRDRINLKNFNSFCAIPIFIENELKYVFVFFSKYVNFMDNLNLELLKKLKDSISINLEKIIKEQTLQILFNALENSPDWVLITDWQGKIIYANKTVERLSKYTKEELIGKTPAILKSGYYDDEFYKKMWSTLLSGEPFSCVILNKDKEGGFFKVEHLIIPVKIDDKVKYFVAVGKDLSREEKLEGEIFNLKYKDLLTNLLNRYGFSVELQNMINKFPAKEKGLLILIDIHNFSYINNIYSEKIGDEILREVGELLHKISGEAIVGRIGGDEFALFKKIKKTETAVDYVKSLIEIFKISRFSSIETVVGVNIGAIIYPDDATDYRQLINNARTSLNIAKSRGENQYEFFNKEIENLIIKKNKERELIIEALENNMFEIYLQPYFYTKDLKLAGFEALLRINHPQRGILTPYHFIETLEDSEYLFEVEKFLIKKTGVTLLKWKEKFEKPKPISINLTGRSFKNREVRKVLEEWLERLKEPLLNIELTERVFIDDFEHSVKIIKEFKKYNLIVSLDDFGTGYSSLAYLTEIPIDVLKIDISFIRKMFEDKKTLAIIDIIVSLAKKLNFKTIAEGVETEEQLKYLKEIGCDIVQGFLLAKPCPVNEAENYLKA